MQRSVKHKRKPPRVLGPPGDELFDVVQIAVSSSDQAVEMVDHEVFHLFLNLNNARNSNRLSRILVYFLAFAAQTIRIEKHIPLGAKVGELVLIYMLPVPARILSFAFLEKRYESRSKPAFD